MYKVCAECLYKFVVKKIVGVRCIRVVRCGGVFLSSEAVASLRLAMHPVMENGGVL